MAPTHPITTTLGATLIACAGLGAAAAEPACQVRSAATVPAVLELYTSEGCSSCPPADRWLSQWNADPSVVALAFHVDYWDNLGWKDRHASPVYTQRQAQQQRTSGARFSYTPQVLLDGIDRPDWPGIAAAVRAPERPASKVQVQLVRQDRHLAAQVLSLSGAPPRLAAYWAVTEQNHVSAVRSGENAGATLHHDFVVSAYQAVAGWTATAGAPATELPYELPAPADPAHPRQVNLVILDADTGRPVQAVKLGC